ncbi:7TM diverse intracellular signaling domain-containing protein [Mucilaginibacter arboris]|uniref:Chromosome partitioning protein ParA n=1 Tax=Mucilaginibacter arboris TaxID=2682090 RepID=A0A7K1SZY0_9SPHI|nr:7TM diverse intracellular signaling domain-containing protein [Mucilaginibacter arboris]MVN22807.1 chromosome partitioning protein ParA [Mucilaginibacter arboris]
MIKKISTGLIFLLYVLVQNVLAQKAVSINSQVKQHFFTGQEIEFLADNQNKLSIIDVKSNLYSSRFKLYTGYYPKHLSNTTCWYRIKFKFTEDIPDQASIIEFFDQTTNSITAYLPDFNGHYIESKTGSNFNFDNRLYKHKNFEFQISKLPKGEYACYFKVQSKDAVNIIMVYRQTKYFVYYALTEYFTYGLFYGIILIFSFHNLLMFIAVKKRQYLYYVLYILSVGLYEMSIDGIAFQYVWPNAPHWNQYAYGFALYSVSLFALVFTKALLHVRVTAPKLYKLINYIIIIRSVYFIYCLVFDNSLFYYKFIEFIPLSIAFITGITIWAHGFKPARFFVLGYTFLTIGFVIKALTVLGYAHAITGIITNYSLSGCFILEMTFLSFSIGDQIRLLRKEKEEAHDETIKLKDSLNKELEVKVRLRTKEVTEKSEELLKQAVIIETQNEELIAINKQLELQAADISRMNILLEHDNIELKSNIEKVTDARILSTELSFEEFSAKYTDQEKCNKFLAEIKWKNGFSCIKCGSYIYKNGRAPYSRRCTSCNYEESVLFNTIFQNSRIPINKAFYLVYLMYTTKGTISSYQLSERLDIRQSTCWQYAIRVKRIMEEKKTKGRKNSNQGWSKLILEIPENKKHLNID